MKVIGCARRVDKIENLATECKNLPGKVLNIIYYKNHKFLYITILFVSCLETIPIIKDVKVI